MCPDIPPFCFILRSCWGSYVYEESCIAKQDCIAYHTLLLRVQPRPLLSPDRDGAPSVECLLRSFDERSPRFEESEPAESLILIRWNKDILWRLGMTGGGTGCTPIPPLAKFYHARRSVK